VIFEPWLYLALIGGCVAQAWRSRNLHRAPITWAALSAFAYFAPYIAVGVAADQRYVWWNTLVGLVCVVMLLDGVGASRSRSEAGGALAPADASRTSAEDD
jgi:hypothetical protein